MKTGIRSNFKDLRLNFDFVVGYNNVVGAYPLSGYLQKVPLPPLLRDIVHGLQFWLPSNYQQRNLSMQL